MTLAGDCCSAPASASWAVSESLVSITSTSDRTRTAQRRFGFYSMRLLKQPALLIQLIPPMPTKIMTERSDGIDIIMLNQI